MKQNKEITPRFHLAFPVRDLKEARTFYIDILGCTSGRESNLWIDYNFYGHQIVTHLSPEDCQPVHTNAVDGNQIPSRHFGVILPWAEWETLARRLESIKVSFLIKPKIRFKNKSGEQGTFFIQDPSGNVLEFKTFKTDEEIFKK